MFNKSKIMKAANWLVKNFGKTLSEALKDAWREAKLEAQRVAIKLANDARFAKVFKEGAASASYLPPYEPHTFDRSAWEAGYYSTLSIARTGALK